MRIRHSCPLLFPVYTTLGKKKKMHDYKSWVGILNILKHHSQVLLDRKSTFAFFHSPFCEWTHTWGMDTCVCVWIAWTDSLLFIQRGKVKDSDVTLSTIFCTEWRRKLHNVIRFHIWLEDTGNSPMDNKVGTATHTPHPVPLKRRLGSSRKSFK